MTDCEDGKASLGGYILEHVLGWEEGASRVMAKKKVFNRCCATPAPEEAYVTMPRVITITARMNRQEKNQMDELFEDCEWKVLCDREGFVDYVWIDEPRFRWDSSLGCGDRPWIGTLTLVCSAT